MSAPSPAAPPPAPTTAPTTVPTAAPPAETPKPIRVGSTLEDKIANAMSAGPAVIAQAAAILDYPEGWPGKWPNEPAKALVELRPGRNGWTCLPDDPNTPGNDPICVNEVYLAVLKARYALVDAPSSGIGISYMLQEGEPIGSPSHLMIFVPGSNKDLAAFGKDPGPLPWVMYPGTTYQHLMVNVFFGNN
jgi:hypothetical protein